MEIHILIPYSLEKNFGKACNESVALIPDGDWIAILDHDCMFLTPDAVKIMYEYAQAYPDSLLTCYTNRVGLKYQCIMGSASANDSIRHWVKQAEKAKRNIPKVEEFDFAISGFLMLFPKSLWAEVGGFTQEKVILGVDNDYGNRILAAGKKIYLMKGLLVWHTYRLISGKQDKSHLK